MLGVYSCKNFDIFSIIYRLLVRKKKIQSLVARRARRAYIMMFCRDLILNLFTITCRIYRTFEKLSKYGNVQIMKVQRIIDNDNEDNYINPMSNQRMINK